MTTRYARYLFQIFWNEMEKECICIEMHKIMCWSYYSPPHYRCKDNQGGLGYPWEEFWFRGEHWSWRWKGIYNNKSTRRWRFWWIPLQSGWQWWRFVTRCRERAHRCLGIQLCTTISGWRFGESNNKAC